MHSSLLRPRLKLLCLAGFMGCGKTTVGKLLASQLGWRFIDLDERIESRAGLRISEIFERLGEQSFRHLESEQLSRVLEESAASDVSIVVALGGGTFAQPPNLELLRAACKPADAPREGFVVWLDCSVDQLFARCVTMDNRPLFRDETTFRKLFDERLPFYRLADFRVDGSGAPREVVERILALNIFGGDLQLSAWRAENSEAHT
jgi:shikimate kinase